MKTTAYFLSNLRTIAIRRDFIIPTPTLRYSEEPDRLSKNPALRSTSEPASPVNTRSMRALLDFLTPSPGTPGEGWGEGLLARLRKTLTLTLSRRTGRGNRKVNEPKRKFPGALILATALPLAFISIGCDKEKSVRSYDVPKESTTPTMADAGAPSEATEVTFPGDLRWTLPAGWTQVAVPANASAMFRPDAAISVSPDDAKLLLTVTHLGDAPGARSVLENVNRWAGQLQLPKMADGDLSKVVTHMKLPDVETDVVDLEGPGNTLLGAIVPHGGDTWFLKLSGPSAAVNEQKEKFANFVHSVHFDANPSVVPPAPVVGPPVQGNGDSSVATGVDGAKWTLPPGWTAEPGSTMRLATIHPGGNGATEIIVSKFAGLGGGLGANATRWRRSVGLDPVDDANADPGQQVTLGGSSWTIHDYTGPADGGKRLIVALLDSNGQTWFFKLIGPTDAVGKVKPAFDQFLASVKVAS